MRQRLISNRYQILKRLGVGAMGEVYKVGDLKNNSIIALKVLSKQKTCSEMVQRFKREFRLLAELHHPNLCEVYDFGMLKDGRSYFTMEYVNGLNIFEFSRKLSCPVRKDIHNGVYSLIVQLCRALEYIHAKGLIHYDIKPGSVLVQLTDNKIDNAVVKLMDFGLADERQLVDGTVIKGTFPYIAPEIIKGKGVSIDHRADLYSLGVLLYEVFIRRSFHSEEKTSFVSLLKRETELVSTLPSKIVSSIPRGIDQLILRLLAVEPAQRYSRANEVIREISKIANMRFENETEKTLEGYLLSSRFVGRDKEMELLKSLYEKARQGESKVILITGDVGIGKSRLSKEFKIFVQLERGYCFTGYAHRDKTQILEPFHDIFKELINYLPTNSKLSRGTRFSLAVLYKIFPDLVNGKLKKHLPILVPLEPQAEKLRVLDALSELVRFVAAELGAMVILLEDLHWADDLSLQFLEYLGRNLGDRNILICGTGRKEETKSNQAFNKMVTNLENEGYFTQLDLKPLNIKSLYYFLDSMITSESNSPGLVKYLMEKTSGNPYFAEEIMRIMFRRRGVIIGEQIAMADFQKIAIPETIEDVVLKRVADLERPSQKVIKFAGVLLKGFNYDMMRHLTGLDDTDLSSALWDLKRRQILVEEGNEYRFYHATLQEAVHKRLGDREKRDLNYKIARTLEKIYQGRQKTVVEDLAHYFINARHKKKGIKYGLQAAKKSSEQFANEQAIRFYKDVLVLISDKNPKLRFDILLKLAHIEGIVGYGDDAFSHLYKALSLKTGSIYKKSLIYFGISGMYASKGYYNKVLYIEQKAKKLLKKMKPGWLRSLLEININCRICETYLSIGDYERACKFNFDISHFPKRGLKEKEMIREQAIVHHALASIEYHKRPYGRDNYDKAIFYYKKAIKYCKKIKLEDHIVVVLNNLGATYLDRFDFQNALFCLQKSIHRAEKIGYHYSVSITLCNLSDIFREKGAYLKALDYAHKAFSFAKKIGNSLVIGIALYETGRCFFQLGNYKEAEGYVEKALNIFRTPHWNEEKFSVLRYLAEIYQAMSDYTKALRLYRKALKNFSEAKYQRDIANLLMNIGSVFTEIGEFSKAKRHIENALKIADTLGLKDVEIEYYMVLCRINIILEDYALATDCYEEGIKKAKKLGMKRRSLQFLLLAAQIYYHKNRYLEGLKIANKSVGLAKDMGTKDLYAEALLMKAKHEIKQDNLSRVELIKILDEATKVAEELDCPEILWKIYYSYGRFFQAHKKYLVALDYYHRCNKIFGDVCAKITKESYKKSYLTRPDRNKVIAAANEIEKLLN